MGVVQWTQQKVHHVETAEAAYSKEQEIHRKNLEEQIQISTDEDMYRQIWRDIKLATNVQ